MKPILLFGATGYTGGLTLDSLSRRKLPCILAGRDPTRLQALAAAHPHVLETRFADANDPSSLRAAFAGASVVVNTVGPFQQWGLPVVAAAVNVGAHYVDSTAEQSFQRSVLENFHHRAKSRNLTILTGHACDFAFSYAGAALLAEKLGPLHQCHTYLAMDGFNASAGTARSALGMLRTPFWTYENGRFMPQPTPKTPKTVLFPEDSTPCFAVPFPGGEVVLLPGEMPKLRDCSAHLVLPQRDAERFARFNAARPTLNRFTSGAMIGLLERLITSRIENPDPNRRAAATWRLLIHGISEKEEATCFITGTDPYGISGETLSLAADWLARGEARAAGVITTGTAFSAAKFLESLKQSGVEWKILPGGPLLDPTLE